MRYGIAIAVLALAGCLPALAGAQEQPAAATTQQALPHRERGWEVAVGGGGTFLGDSLAKWVQVTNKGSSRLALGGDVRIEYHFTNRWGLSAGTGIGYTSPATVMQPFVALTWTPNLDSRTSPFLLAGFGATFTKWTDPTCSGGNCRITGYGAHLGVGLRQTLSEKLAFRIEIRSQFERYDAASIKKPVFNGIGTVGLSWFFGGGREAVASVAVDPRMVTLSSLGETQQIAAALADQRGRPLTGRAVTWTSSNDSVASVTAGGLVTAVGNGSATITAASEAVSGTASVNVSQTVATLTVLPDADTLTAIGQTRQFAINSQDANNNPIANPQVTWSSSGPAVTITASGLATAERNGTATITATAAGGSTATATVTVAQAIASVSVAPPAATITAAGGKVQFIAHATDANGRPVTGKVITWSGGAPDVATLGPTGLATAVGNGTAQITATVEEQSGSATVTVAIPARAAPAPAPAPVAAAPALPTVNATVVLKNVIFRPNSAVLPPEALPGLDAVASALRDIPNARWEIGGYTSNMGDAARNQVLSRRRALAVRTYLVRQGVLPARLVAVGYGAQNPVASNATVAGRRQNMRVEIKRLR